MAKEKVVLAYSGGLDTTAIIPWLKENYDYDVKMEKNYVVAGKNFEFDIHVDHVSGIAAQNKVITVEYNNPYTPHLNTAINSILRPIVKILKITLDKE